MDNNNLKSKIKKRLTIIDGCDIIIIKAKNKKIHIKEAKYKNNKLKCGGIYYGLS